MKLRNNLRSYLQNRYGTPSVQAERLSYSEQLAYGHREILVEYLGLPKKAYFKAVVSHAKHLPFELDPIYKLIDRNSNPILQLLWRTDAEIEAKKNEIANVRSIGAPGLYALANLGQKISETKSNIFKVSENRFWSQSNPEIIDFLSGKKILVMPLHSWDGDVVKHTGINFQFLNVLEPSKVTVCLSYLDFCDPKIRNLYLKFGWKVECAGIRASKEFGSPAGGRMRFLYELINIIDKVDVVIADELTTGLLYAACLAKDIGLVRNIEADQLIYSKWTNSKDFLDGILKIRQRYPWLENSDANYNNMFSDICTSVGIDVFKSKIELEKIAPWYEELELP